MFFGFCCICWRMTLFCEVSSVSRETSWRQLPICGILLFAVGRIMAVCVSIHHPAFSSFSTSPHCEDNLLTAAFISLLCFCSRHLRLRQSHVSKWAVLCISVPLTYV